MLESILDIIANICSVFGITIHAKAFYEKLKSKKYRILSIFISLGVCCGLAAYLYASYQKSITVTKVVLNEKELTMSAGNTYPLTATVLYSDNSSDHAVLWSSSNSSVLTVDEKGVITAVAKGNASVIAQASKNNTTEIAECFVTVKSPPSGYSISVDQQPVDSYAYIYVKPYDNDITSIQIYGKSPSGEIFTPNQDVNDLYHFYSECGTWTIYASVENEAGIYEAHKPEDFVTIEVTNVLGGSGLYD